MRQIPQITKAEFGNHFVKNSQPCLILDGLSGWKAENFWTPSALTNLCGDRSTRVAVSHSGHWRFNADGTAHDPTSQYTLLNVPFRTAAEWICSAKPEGHKYYVSQADLLQYPELLKEARWMNPANRSRLLLWFGTAGTVTGLHFDLSQNLFAQIYGTKTVTLVPPNALPFLYAFPDNSPMSHMSAVDVEAPDLRAFPLFPNAETHVLKVQPGQVLFIPATWWHHVRANDLSISVSQWSLPEFDELKGPTALRLLAREYVRDRWSGIRTARNLTREQLFSLAETLSATDPPTAVLAAAVALEESDRWPRAIRHQDPLATAARQRLQAMVVATTGGLAHTLRTEHVAEIISEVRRAVSEHDLAPEELARSVSHA